MRAPGLKVICIGEVSPWGRQFLGDLEQHDVIQLSYEPNHDRLQDSELPSADTPVYFIENFPESRSAIARLSKSGRAFFVIWFGRTFSKEDYQFALDQRVYAVFENPKGDDGKIASRLERLSNSQESSGKHQHLIRSMKSILLQAETEDKATELVNEMRTAIHKIEQCVLSNEFSHGNEAVAGEKDEKLPFYQAQGFGDALLTVEDLERTGVLWVRGNLPGQEGKIEFLQGRVMSAVAGEVHGLKALYRMFLWDEPRFLFSRREAQSFSTETHLDVNLKSIVKEGFGHRSRYEKIRKEIPPNDLVLGLEPGSLHPDTGLTPPDFATLATLLEFGRVSEILDYSTLPDVTVYESLIHLKKERFIRVTGFPMPK